MRVLFLTKYDRLAANTRYRCLQYIPYLKKEGIDCIVSPLLDDDHLRFKFDQGRYQVVAVLQAYWRRLKELLALRKYDLVVLHYELFPYLPALFERILSLLGIRYVYDFDDAIFHQYDVHRRGLVRLLLRNKISSVIRRSSAVIAGNSYLASYAGCVSENVTVVPTVVDPGHYASSRLKENRDVTAPFTIGWVGSPSTVEYVKAKADALRTFCAKHNAQLILVGSGPIELPGVPLVVREWSEQTELEELRKFDVGIMPLSDDPWARGKCGFKLIQYMACGLPVVASPVGVNRELVIQGVSGYLASSDDEWVEALEKIYVNRDQRLEMGLQGLKLVEKKYSVPLYAPVVAKVLWNALPAKKRVALEHNIDEAVTDNFGDEWVAFPHSTLPRVELRKIFEEYFHIFPWSLLSREKSVGIDVGCGSGRWALFVAPLVKKLICVDASKKALNVARRNLREFRNTDYVTASIGRLPFDSASVDFAYSIGVLHHVPNPEKGIKEIARILKPGSPFLIYVYYAFDNRGPIYKLIWRMSDLGRRGISYLPFRYKYWVSQLLAALVYWPSARVAQLLSRLNLLPRSWMLSYYMDKAFYVMRTDALDRFGTRLEKRFTKSEVQKMLEDAGFMDIKFSDAAPYWVAVGYKQA